MDSVTVAADSSAEKPKKQAVADAVAGQSKKERKKAAAASRAHERDELDELPDGTPASVAPGDAPLSFGMTSDAGSLFRFEDAVGFCLGRLCRSALRINIEPIDLVFRRSELPILPSLICCFAQLG